MNRKNNVEKTWDDCKDAVWMWRVLIKATTESEGLAGLAGAFIEDCKSRHDAWLKKYFDAYYSDGRVNESRDPVKAAIRAGVISAEFSHPHTFADEKRLQAEWLRSHAANPFT
jgi:hypothetical protein